MKKILSIVLSLIMILTVFPIANVSAAEVEEITPRQELKNLLDYYNTYADYSSCEWYASFANSRDVDYISRYNNGAKKDAESILADENATDEDIISAIDELKNKRYYLMNKELKHLILYYRCEFFNLPEYWYDYYTQESYDVCYDTFQTLLAVNKNKDASIDERISAINDFMAAYDNLVEVEPPQEPAPDTPRQRLFELLTYYATELDYTNKWWHNPIDLTFIEREGRYSPSYDGYYYAEQAAIALLADENTTDEEFEDMITEIEEKKLAMMRDELEVLDFVFYGRMWIWDYSMEYWYKVYTKESLDLFIDLGRKAVKIYYHNEDTSVEECKTLIEDYIASYDNLTRISFDFTYGDINKDGEVSILDAIIAQKVVIGLNSFTDLGTEIADVDGDKKITLKDAILIQKKAVKLVDEFSVGTSFSTYLQVSKTEPYDYYDATIN